MKDLMLRITNLFEAHLTVSNLERSLDFFERVVGLHLAETFSDRRAAFCWVGEYGQSMLGIWEVARSPQRTRQHIAFRVEVPDILRAAAHLNSAGVDPLDFEEEPTNEPVVLAWMPAISLYFHDPDGNLLELVSMLADKPEPALGVITLTDWLTR